MVGKRKDKEHFYGFQIDEGVIYYYGTAINTHCISMIYSTSVNKNFSWILAVILLIFSIIAYPAIHDWYAIIISIIWIMLVVIYNMIRGKNLVVKLNSGDTLFFHSCDREFLDEIVVIMTECINTGNGHYFVDFKECVINHGTINSQKELIKKEVKEIMNVTGNNNDVYKVEKNEGPVIIDSFNSNDEQDNFDYSKLSALLTRVILDSNDKTERYYAQDAKDFIEKDDKAGLKNFIKKNWSTFVSGTFSSIAGGALTKLFESLISR